MPPGFYAILVLLLVLLAIGGMAWARALQRRARHKADEIDLP